MIWNILIPTIVGREQQFEEIYNEIYRQTGNLELWNEIQVISKKDNRELSVGVKRQMMLEESVADYISHIDDDDKIHPDYIHLIYEALKSKPDCVGFNVDCDFPDQHYTAVVSNRYKEWENNKDGYDYVRSPNHLAVIKREHCLKVGFPDLRHGEDYVFSKGLVEQDLLKNEVFIPQQLYIYRFNPNK